MLKKTLIMTSVVVAIVGVNIKILPLLKEDTMIMSKVSNSYQIASNNKSTSLLIPNAYKTNAYKSLLFALDNGETKSTKKDNIVKKEDDTPKVEEGKIEDLQGAVTSLKEERENNTSSVLKTETEKENVSKKEIDSSLVENDINLDSEINVNFSNTKEVPTIYYDRITSIYENDNITLIRREYYVNNRLAYYSFVKQFDAATVSYVELIYQYNYETNSQVLIRTDIYRNGRLENSY